MLFFGLQHFVLLGERQTHDQTPVVRLRRVLGINILLPSDNIRGNSSSFSVQYLDSPFRT